MAYATGALRRVRGLRSATGQFASAARETRFQHTFKNATSETTINTGAIRAHARREFVGMTGQAMATAVALARERVAPGVGPGPHPHKDWGWPIAIDTGNLRSAIKWGWEHVGGKSPPPVGTMTALLYIDAQIAPYGTWLEHGWHGPSGKFYRYPFLAPAMREALGTFGRFVRQGKALRY